MVCKMSDSCDTETVRKAVEITVVDLKRFDLAKYARDKLSLSQRILSWLLQYVQRLCVVKDKHLTKKSNT